MKMRREKMETWSNELGSLSQPGHETLYEKGRRIDGSSDAGLQSLSLSRAMREAVYDADIAP